MKLGSTDLEVSRLCLGSDIFGWTIDAREAFAVLDAYAEAGGNFIDTADFYSAWVDGHSGGEAESLIGAWMAARNNRSEMVVATKAGKFPGNEGLSPANIRTAVEASLQRLQTDHIDLYYAHLDDLGTPLEDTMAGFDAVVRSGAVRWIGASNYTASRLADALAISRREGLAEYAVVESPYNLIDRSEHEDSLAPLCIREQLPLVPYWSLAKGYLSGKYRGDAPVSTRRAEGFGGAEYGDERGVAVLGALDEVAAARETTVAAVALAWLLAQPQVVAPIVGIRAPEQVADVFPAIDLRLTSDELAQLAAAGRRHATSR